MRRLLLVAVTAVSVWPVVGSAQVSGSVNTSAGGPIDTRVGGSINGRVDTGGRKTDAPRDVLNYVRGLGKPGGTPTGGGISVGDTVSGATVRSVPGQDNWGYAVVNGQRVIINRQTDTVSDIVR